MTGHDRSDAKLFGTHSALIVEDSHLMRQLIRSLLRGFGFDHVGEAADGSEALEMIELRSYDIIICDWMMEPTDGFSFLGQLRRHPSPHLRSLPVIMLTSVAEELQVVAARDAGVTEYLVKPVSADKLRLRLLSALKRPRAFVTSENYTGPDRRRRDTKTPGAPARRFSDRLNEISGDEELPSPDLPTPADYQPVLRAELRRLSEISAEIKADNGQQAEPWIVMARIAHDLKGQAASFGFEVISALAGRLEMLSRPVAREPRLMQAPMERRIRSVQRHVDALHLIHEQNVLAATLETDALLERFDRAIERVNREVDTAAVPQRQS